MSQLIPFILSTHYYCFEEIPILSLNLLVPLKSNKHVSNNSNVSLQDDYQIVKINKLRKIRFLICTEKIPDKRKTRTRLGIKK